MTRSRDFSRILGRSVANNTFTTTGNISASGGVTAHNYTSVADFVDAEANAAALEDGSLHYLTKLRKMYVWDDSDASFYLLGQQDSALERLLPYSFRGSVSGYTSGGQNPPAVNVIDKFPFSADANATDVGDLSAARRQLAGQSSSTHGYNTAGYNPGSTPQYYNVIDKFPFATDGNASDVGDLINEVAAATGNSSETYGYTSGGYGPAYSPLFGNRTIEKHPFSSDTNSSDVGDLTQNGAPQSGNGANSADNGYVLGKKIPPWYAGIDKFSFASDGNAVDIGDLLYAAEGVAGVSSSTHGYGVGGRSPTLPTSPPYMSDIIQKFPFSADGNSTDVGDITQGREKGAGSSSQSNGYAHGGLDSFQGPPAVNIIEKFPFSTDANSADVGDLTVSRGAVAGQQV